MRIRTDDEDLTQKGRGRDGQSLRNRKRNEPMNIPTMSGRTYRKHAHQFTQYALREFIGSATESDINKKF